MEKYEKMKSFDPEVYAAIQDETNRQNNKIELIASENFVSERIMEANGSPLTNKYAEGYPGKRYYGGCEYVDVVERSRLRELKSCLTRALRMCRRIAARRLIWLYSLRCSHPVTRFFR